MTIDTDEEKERENIDDNDIVVEEKQAQDDHKSVRPDISKSKSKFQQAAKSVQLLSIVGSKVDQANKIGSELDGWCKEAALVLQQAIAAEGRGESPEAENFQAPGREHFLRVREYFKFSPARYAATLGIQTNQTTPSLRLVGSSAAAGRSGAVFFLSPDQQLIVKSCTQRDWTTMLKILPSYVEYVEKCKIQDHAANNADIRFNTFLPAYMGLYGFNVDGKQLQVIVMTNIFAGARKINRRYDLKGSTKGRTASQKEVEKRNPVYKDLDWLSKERKIAVPEGVMTVVAGILRRDANFLDNMGLIDYSLLLGIHDCDEFKDSPRESVDINVIKDSTRVCYAGIVDILTPYRFAKRMETLFSGTLRCCADVSCQPPHVYAARFSDFMEHSVLSCTE